jgi:hypothetical protein
MACMPRVASCARTNGATTAAATMVERANMTVESERDGKNF